MEQHHATNGLVTGSESPQNAPSQAIVVLPPRDRPARFERWPDDMKDRCRELWASIGNRNAGRVEWLLSREVPEDVAIPASVTIRQWAREEHWGAWADADLSASHGRTLRELQTGWLAALKLSQETLIDAMCGRLDHLPHAGAGRIKSAEVTVRLIAQSGLLALVPEPEAQASTRQWDEMSLEEREAFMREGIQARKGGR